MPDHLTPLPDADWSRVLCVAAHPDDLEYGTSAAVATWTRRGVEVVYLLLTAGEAGIAEIRLRAFRRRERQAALPLGVSPWSVAEGSSLTATLGCYAVAETGGAVRSVTVYERPWLHRVRPRGGVGRVARELCRRRAGAKCWASLAT